MEAEEMVQHSDSHIRVSGRFRCALKLNVRDSTGVGLAVRTLTQQYNHFLQRNQAIIDTRLPKHCEGSSSFHRKETIKRSLKEEQ